MRTVITISLNGTAYQLEATGYEALRAYLQVAEQRLAGNPDQAEILADLEQAIADKCNRFLTAHKNVITVQEVAQVIQEMGPVDGGATEAAAGTGAGADSAPGGGDGGAPGISSSGSAGAASEPPRRLYQIREGAAISGVCNGLAAYLNLDVSIIRILFIVLAILTGGVWILVYIVMMFVIPHAETSEQHAAAHGWPFNAEELIARAKSYYASFQESEKWRRRQWRDERRMWRNQRKQWKAQQRAWERWGSAGGTAQPPPPHNWSHAQSANMAQPPSVGPQMSYSSQVLSGFLSPIVAILSTVVFLTFLFALLSLVTRHAIFGWALPSDIPLWLGILVLAILWGAIGSPLHQARRMTHYAVPYGFGWVALCGTLIWLAFVSFLCWLAWEHWSEVQAFLKHVAGAASALFEHSSQSPTELV